MATAETISDRVAVARSLTNSVRDFVGGLSEDQLARASACSEWQVIDVVSHLVGGAERQLASVRRGRAGQSGPPEGFVPLSNDELSATNAQRDRERRQQFEGGILDAFDSGYAELYEELGPIRSRRLVHPVLAHTPGRDAGRRIRGPPNPGTGHSRLGHPLRFRPRRVHQPPKPARVAGHVSRLAGNVFPAVRPLGGERGLPLRFGPGRNAGSPGGPAAKPGW